MLNDLRKVPPRAAAVMVAGAALVTLLLFSAAEAIVGDGSPRPAARKTPEPIVLDDAYPDRPRDEAPEEEPPPTAPAERPKVPLRELVGQKLMVRMSGPTPSPALLRRVRRGQVGGIVLFPDNVPSPAGLREALRRLQGAARAGGSPGLLVAVDQEGGPVRRLPAGPPARSPREIGATGSEDVSEEEGAATGAYLRRLDVNVDLAPVVDVPSSPQSFISSRSFGDDPRAVARLGTAFARGLAAGGVAATAKHFPGLGSASANTDRAPSIVDGSRGALRGDIVPFRTAIDAGVQLVMMATAVYPAYDSGTPATFSTEIVTGELRDRLGFDGVVITDDLETPAVRSVMTPAEAAVAAADAGVDVALFATSEAGSRAAYDRLLAAARSGRLSRESLEASYERIRELQEAVN